jgi:hypothetical protein
MSHLPLRLFRPLNTTVEVVAAVPGIPLFAASATAAIRWRSSSNSDHVKVIWYQCRICLKKYRRRTTP